jgi:hypothetical protein
MVDDAFTGEKLCHLPSAGALRNRDDLIGREACRSTMATPKKVASPAMTRRLRRPLRAESMPPRGRRTRLGGLGVAIGLIASLGLRGTKRGDCEPE